jgi:glyoxylase-like metal-dependent hydrolase (beta-lactamase superfamily II)
MDLGEGLTVDLRMSGIWQLESIVLTCDRACAIVDPAYFPRELSELRALVDERGRAEHVVFTHGHWDHVMGWRTFPEAQILASSSLVEAAATRNETSAKNLADAYDFDGRWYVPRTGPYEWPEKIEAVTEGDQIELGRASFSALHFPGHSDDGLALISKTHGILILGDYLSPCEIPFIESLEQYQATLVRLLGMLDDVEHVIPGHGPMLTREEARAIALADSNYLEAIASCATRGIVDEALNIALPRAGGTPVMAEHHLINLRKSGLVL